MTAVVLLSHGSPDPRSSAAARDLADRFARHAGTVAVAAFLQHDDPDLTAACRNLAAAGLHDAVVVPMLVTPAFHARVDVPAAIAGAEPDAGVRLTLAEPLGTDVRLLPALDRHLAPGPVVLAAAGTSDVTAQRRLRWLADHWSVLRSAPVAVAYASQSEPDVGTAITDLEAATGQRVGVASFVLYPGILPDRITAAAGHRRVTPPLSGEDELLHLIEERVHHAHSDRTTPTARTTLTHDTTPTYERTPA